MKKIFINVILSLMLTGCADRSYHNKSKSDVSCYSYREKVFLKGKFIQKRIPEVAEKKGHYWMIILKEPICTEISAQEVVYEPFTGEKEIQIALREYHTHKNLLNKEVTVTGTLFGAHTGHHYTKILINADKIQEQK